jgi:glutamine cyclotransferase
MKRILPFLAFITLTATRCKDDKGATPDTDNSTAIKPPAVMNYNVMKTYPHDATSFTEGFELHGNTMYESGGDPDYVGKVSSWQRT